MSDNESGELVPRGNEWEVVTLTESAYAAAPGPGPQHGILDSDAAETDRAMLVSGHFGSSLSKHENLPSEVEKEESGKSESKNEENLNIEGLICNELEGKDDNVSYYSSEFGDVTPSNLTEKEPSVYHTSTFGSQGDEPTADISNLAEEGSGIDEPTESVENVAKHNEENKYNEPSNHPCEAWWRKHAASLYGHAKNVNPLWSIVVVAAVMGLVVIGHRWHRSKSQVFKLKPQLALGDKGSGWIIGPGARLKDVNLSGQHSSYNRVSSFAEH